MSEAESIGSSNKVLIGKIAGSSSVLQVEYQRAIQGTDELIRTPNEIEFVAPGFVDVQVNGFAGVDYNDPSASREAIARSIRTMFGTGVTRFFPTVITGSRERMMGALQNLAAAKEEFCRNNMPEGDAIEAFHVEGPNISPEDGPRGAHPIEHIRPPDIEEFKRWQEAANGDVRLVTVSPEWPGIVSYIGHVVRSAAVASIGHTKATSEQIRAALDAGASMSTHLGNAAHPLLPKTQNYIFDQLAADGLAASFIVDGIHIPPPFFHAAVRAKGIERSVLITDAVMPAMCSPGPYKLGQVDVELRANGSVVMHGTTRLAGSALRMDQAVGNAVRLGGVSLRDALVMASTNPARVTRIAGRQRGLAPGEKADFVRFSWDESAQLLTVRETVVAGSTVYRA
ncbi:MAG: amidohydrolase family protein [Acidobacteriaceae bacterium]|nr:amidohydrolase family protein [Acidobacteriaceae bacterium]MBV9781056.1 amidohydrolase family protein [Acidobacteriaceae bacterium]